MADLSYIDATQEVKIVGQDSTGNRANFVGADANGNMQTKDFADGTTGSAVPTTAIQIGGTDGTNLRAVTTDASGNQKIVGTVASAASDSGNPVKTGAVFNSTLPTVTTGQRVDSQADLNGRLIVASAPLDSYKATYSSAATGLVPAVLPTDVVTIAGSASKTVRITRISVTLTTTAGSGIGLNILLIKRSALDTGGTSATQTNVPHDSSSAASGATIKSYTANPTGLGAAVGTVRTIRYAVASSNSIIIAEWDFGNRPSKAIVLRGTSENLAINANATSITGGIMDVDIEWTEE